jgi:hypothetical protein
LARFFSGLDRFFFIWVWFGPFWAYKTETEPVGFLKILIGFFQSLIFSVIFFSGSLGLIGFSIFLLTPSCHASKLLFPSLNPNFPVINGFDIAI